MIRHALRAVALLAALVAVARAAPAPLILISLDGFRWDYTEKYARESPTLRELQREGVTARGLAPVFPSHTFPNHYTIVTGLYPARHGIVNNEFFDPDSGLFFRYNQSTSVRDPRWWRGEPIWVTAIKQGRPAATAFWVGSESEVAGVRPTHWRPFDYAIPFERRLDELAGWFAGDRTTWPAVVAFYLEETNSAGHAHGPDAPEVAAAVKLSDERIAALLTRLRAQGIEPNLMIVSDHGMTATHLDRIVVLDDFLDRAKVQVDSDGSVVALRPLDGDEAGLLRAMQRVPHARAYRVAELPPHFHFGGDPRIAPIWVLPDEGWHVALRATVDRLKRRYAARGYLGGDHGYDPALPSMHGIFIAHGPAFRRGVQLEPVENIHLYNLMCAVLNLKPAPNDGDNRLAPRVLAQ